jgi:hypothetical protein
VVVVINALYFSGGEKCVQFCSFLAVLLAVVFWWIAQLVSIFVKTFTK